MDRRALIVGLAVVTIALAASGLAVGEVTAQETADNGTLTDGEDATGTIQTDAVDDVSDDNESIDIGTSDNGRLGNGPLDNGTVDTETETSESDRSMGATVSAFAQVNAAAAESRVDGGMFERGLERAETATEREELFERHTRRLSDRLERLNETRERIEADSPENASAVDVAKAAHVRVGAEELADSLERTDKVSNQRGFGREIVDDLRQNASSLDGSKVAALAADVPGVGLTKSGEKQGKAGGPDGENQGPDQSDQEDDASGKSTQSGSSEDSKRPSDAEQSDSPEEPGDTGRADSGNDKRESGGSGSGNDLGETGRSDPGTIGQSDFDAADDNPGQSGDARNAKTSDRATRSDGADRT